MWILRILGPIKFCKGPIKISNGPLKFGNLHVFEWDMGHWPNFMAHHHFWLGLTLSIFELTRKKIYERFRLDKFILSWLDVSSNTFCICMPQIL